MNLSEAIAMMEALLDKLAHSGFFLNAPIAPKDQVEPYDGPCSVCGKHMTIAVKEYIDVFGSPRRAWSDHERTLMVDCYVWKLPQDDGRFLDFPVCSDECKLIGERISKCLLQKRIEEWERIRTAKLLLTEARAWLRHPEVLPSHKKESTQQPTSPN